MGGRKFVRVSETDLAFFFMDEISCSFRFRFFDFFSEGKRGKGLFNIMLFCDVGLFETARLPVEIREQTCPIAHCPLHSFTQFLLRALIVTMSLQ
jgi:hypothetical protein